MTRPRHVEQLIDEFKDIFKNLPRGLPPERTIAHYWVGYRVKTVVIPPHKYPNVFKDEIEKVIKKSLDLGHVAPTKVLLQD